VNECITVVCLHFPNLLHESTDTFFFKHKCDVNIGNRSVYIHAYDKLWHSVHLQLQTSQHRSKALFRYKVSLAISDSEICQAGLHEVKSYWKAAACLNDWNSMDICCWYISKSYVVPCGSCYTFFMHYVITSGLLYNAFKVFEICLPRVMPPRHHGVFSSWTKEMYPYWIHVLWSILVLLFLANSWKNFPFLRASAYFIFYFLSSALHATKQATFGFARQLQTEVWQNVLAN
jgi:hypothetical protein